MIEPMIQTLLLPNIDTFCLFWHIELFKNSSVIDFTFKIITFSLLKHTGYLYSTIMYVHGNTEVN